jgi:hypothetical protein
MLYLGMGDTFGICQDLDMILNSCYRNDAKTNYTTLLKSSLEKEMKYSPQNEISRRDLLRKSQGRNGYCRHTNIYSENGKNKISSRIDKKNKQIAKAKSEKSIQEALSRKNKK